MAFLQWKDAYSVGVERFDEQHKELISLINHLNEAMAQRKASEELEPVLDALVDYAAFHFSEEEIAMKSVRYEEYYDHVAKHREFVEKVKEFQQDFKEGKLMLSLNVMNFLKDWLVQHIQGTDKRYGAILAATP